MNEQERAIDALITQLALDVLINQAQRIKTFLGELVTNNNPAAATVAALNPLLLSTPGVKLKKDGTPRKRTNSFWENKTEDERRQIMRERWAKSKTNMLERATKKATKKATKAAKKAPQGARTSGPGSYWDSMTEEERRAEMRRRMAVSKQKRIKAGQPLVDNHPRNPSHPGHAAYIKRISEARKAAIARKAI